MSVPFFIVTAGNQVHLVVVRFNKGNAFGVIDFYFR